MSLGWVGLSIGRWADGGRKFGRRAGIAKTPSELWRILAAAEVARLWQEQTTTLAPRLWSAKSRAAGPLGRDMRSNARAIPT